MPAVLLRTSVVPTLLRPVWFSPNDCLMKANLSHDCLMMLCEQMTGCVRKIGHECNIHPDVNKRGEKICGFFKQKKVPTYSTRQNAKVIPFFIVLRAMVLRSVD
jgi:hypothetical protein